MELSFSRGFSHGFFDGNNHKVLVRGDYAKKRGVFVGEVASVVGSRIRLDLAAPVKPGDGLVLDGDEASRNPRARRSALRSRPDQSRRNGRAGSSASPERPRGARRRPGRTGLRAERRRHPPGPAPASGSGRPTTPS